MNKQSGIKSFFFFVPSLITFMSVICGMWSIYCVFTGQNIMIAVCLIAIAACLDGFDGRVARLLGVNGNFGLELDSLADFFSFGIAPTFVYFSYLVSSYELQSQYIVFALLILFPIAMACRLARFNITALDDKIPQKIKDFKKNFFCGLPAPAGAIALLIPILLDNLNNQVNFSCYCVPLGYALFVAFLLVSPFPMPSLKGFHFGIKSIKDVLFTICFIGICAYFLVYPVKCLFFISLLYVLAIPFTWLKYNIGLAKINKELAIVDKKDVKKESVKNENKYTAEKKREIKKNVREKQINAIKKQHIGAKQGVSKVIAKKRRKNEDI